MEPTASDLDRIREIYRQGLYRQAWDAATPTGDPAAWTGTEARIFAGRLYTNLGNVRRGHALHIRAWREDRDHPAAVYYMSRVLLDRRGPLPAWRFLRAYEIPSGAPAETRSDLLAGLATSAGMLRDFTRADRYMEEAARADPENPWVPMERAWLLEMEDRYDEALAAARGALELRPGYRPGIQAVGRLLVLLGRDREAQDILTEGAERLESGHLVRQLVDLLVEQGQYGEAKRWLDRLPDLWPVPDKLHRETLAGLRSDVAYLLHDVDAAIEHSRGVDHHFYRRVRENLEAAAPDAKRVLLYVPFIRQHHMTCSAATLASIADFWSRPIHHETVAKEIVYAGARAVDEREWGAAHGFRVREFTLSWDSQKALIDRGIPFTLVTAELSSSHLQAVVGYDARRGTLLIRDPFVPSLQEFLFKETMDRYASVGPRCMALVPEDQAGKLDGIDLPDAEFYDGQFEVAVALRGHDRERAQRAVEGMAATAPDHIMTLAVRLDLAAYDRDTPARLSIIDRLLERFPDSEHWKFRKLLPLWELGRRTEHLEMLAGIAGADTVQAAFLEQYAQSLLEDGGRPADGLRAIRKAIRRTSTSASAYYILGRIHWALRNFDDALEAFRFATCLDDTEEQYASHWFSAARQRGLTERALEMLADRVERFGARSSAPARTLAGSLSEIDRIPEMLAVLDRALEIRPEDGDLLLYAAWEYSVRGDLERGRELLDRGRSLVREPHWLRNAADIARFAGDLRESLERILECVALEPLNTDAQREAMHRLTELEGREAALAHLDAVLERFPHHVGLAGLRNEWLVSGDPERAEAAARGFAATHPNHAPAHRGLASVLVDMGRFDEALEVLERAAELDPVSVSLHNLRGNALALAGRTEAAAEALREAIRLDVDNGWGIQRLVAILPDGAEAAAALRFVRDELRRQVTDGTGLSKWRDEARNLIEASEVLEFLHEFERQRPDLRSVPGDIVRQLRDMGRLDEAWEAVVAATERFPLVPKLWTLRAEIAYLRGDADGEVAALEHAVSSRPGWCYPLRLLAEAWERQGDFERSLSVCRAAVARDPADPYNHGFLADALRRLDRKADAIDSLRRAVELNPEYEWAWNTLDELARDAGEPGLAAKLARTLAERRSGEAENWIRLARMLGEDGAMEERLDALARAEALEPGNADVHDHRAVILAEQRLFDEAAAACRPAVFGSSPPLVLRGREIWVKAERGRLAEALEEMEKLLEEDDAYAWGWSRLFQWAEALEDKERLTTAAENLIRLDPNDAVALARLGDAREEAEDAEGAFGYFERASILTPSYRYVGYRAMVTAISLERLPEARAAAERVGPYLEPWEAAAFDADCLAAEGRREEAIACFAGIVRNADADGWSVREAAEALEKAGWEDDVGTVLRAALDEKEIGGAGAAFVVKRLADKGRWPAARAAVRGLAAREDIWREGAQAYLRESAMSEKAGTLTGFLDEFEERLRDDARLWGLSIWALACTNCFSRGVAWSKGWRERDGVDGWMLENIAHCHRAGFEDEAAAAVSRYALEHERDHSASLHEVWLAFDAVLVGDDARARERLARVDPRGLSPVHQVPLAFTEALLDLAEGGKSAAPAARRRIDRVFEDFPWARRDALATRQRSRTVRAAWSRAKTVGTFFWMVVALIPRPR